VILLPVGMFSTSLSAELWPERVYEVRVDFPVNTHDGIVVEFVWAAANMWKF